MAEISKKPSDNKAREEALGMGSFIVQAPAGSGKTSLLVKRFLNLLLKVKSPKEVLALTFTNKAAAEMVQRIKDVLKGQSEDDELKKIKENLGTRDCLFSGYSLTGLSTILVKSIYSQFIQLNI